MRGGILLSNMRGTSADAVHSLFAVIAQRLVAVLLARIEPLKQSAAEQKSSREETATDETVTTATNVAS